MGFSGKRKGWWTVNKYKAKLVAKGFNQVQGFDFSWNFFSSYQSMAGICIHFDVNNAFINETLQETVYMTQPSGFHVSDKTLVCRLNKAI